MNEIFAAINFVQNYFLMKAVKLNRFQKLFLQDL